MTTACDVPEPPRRMPRGVWWPGPVPGPVVARARARALAPVLCAALIVGCARESGSDLPGGTGAAAAVESGPAPLGRSVVDDLPTRWIGTAPGFGAGSPARATLVRYWTDTCPFCEASLPAVEALRREFGERGLRTVGVYHPKPSRAVTDAQVTAAAERLGYHGLLAVDETWEALERLWPRDSGRRATSVSFLLDADGMVRFVHPGPEFHPSEEPDHADCNADYDALRAAILLQLGD